MYDCQGSLWGCSWGCEYNYGKFTSTPTINETYYSLLRATAPMNPISEAAGMLAVGALMAGRIMDTVSHGMKMGKNGGKNLEE